jgi:DNA-directed RNA polymerase specialized sigma24 family protein
MYSATVTLPNINWGKVRKINFPKKSSPYSKVSSKIAELAKKNQARLLAKAKARIGSNFNRIIDPEDIVQKAIANLLKLSKKNPQLRKNILFPKDRNDNNVLQILFKAVNNTAIDMIRMGK